MSRTYYVSLMAGSPWGGSEDCWYENLNRHLREAPERSFSVICSSPNEQIRAELTALGVQYEVAPWSFGGRHSFASRIRSRIIGESWRQRALYDKTRAMFSRPGRVLINQGGSYCIASHPYLVKALEDLQLTFDLVCHAPILGMPSESQISQMNIAAKYCRRIYVLSDAAISDLTTFFAIDEGKFEIFKNPIANDFPASAAVADGKLRLGFVGRLSSTKGIDFVVRLLLEKSSPAVIESMHFFGVGNIPLSVIERVRENGIEVVFHGTVEAKADIYRKFDVLLLPSRIEALPNVLIEAGLYGKFPIVPHIGSTDSAMPSDWPYYVNTLHYGSFRAEVFNVLNLPRAELRGAAAAFQASVRRYSKQRQLISF